jgi:hypothetical protein
VLRHLEDSRRQRLKEEVSNLPADTPSRDLAAASYCPQVVDEIIRLLLDHNPDSDHSIDLRQSIRRGFTVRVHQSNQYCDLCVLQRTSEYNKERNAT